MALGFSPLDEELGLLPGGLTPRLQEALVRLSTHIPSFTKAAQELTWFTGAHLHPDTARARTEAAGAVLAAYETAEATRVLQEHPAPPCVPDSLILSVDGAMCQFALYTVPELVAKGYQSLRPRCTTLA